jgi:hypothetical protein
MTGIGLEPAAFMESGSMKEIGDAPTPKPDAAAYGFMRHVASLEPLSEVVRGKR